VRIQIKIGQIFFSSEVLYDYPEFSFNIEPTAVDSQEMDLALKYKAPKHPASGGDTLQYFHWLLQSYSDNVSIWVDDILYIEGEFIVDEVHKKGYMQGKIVGRKLYWGAYPGDYLSLENMLYSMTPSDLGMQFVLPSDIDEHCVLDTITPPNQYYELSDNVLFAQTYNEEGNGSWAGKSFSNILVSLARVYDCFVAQIGKKVVFFPKYNCDLQSYNLIEVRKKYEDVSFEADIEILAKRFATAPTVKIDMPDDMIYFDTPVYSKVMITPVGSTSAAEFDILEFVPGDYFVIQKKDLGSSFSCEYYNDFQQQTNTFNVNATNSELSEIEHTVTSEIVQQVKIPQDTRIAYYHFEGLATEINVGDQFASNSGRMIVVNARHEPNSVDKKYYKVVALKVGAI